MGRCLRPRRGRYLQQGDRAGEVPQSQELFQLRHLLPFLPPPVSRRRGAPHGRLGPGEHLGRKQSGARSERGLGGACPPRGGGKRRSHPAPPAPPPLTILPPGPGSSLRRRRRCQGNRGTAEGGGAEPSAAANRGRLATGAAPQGSASAAAGVGLRSDHGMGGSAPQSVSAVAGTPDTSAPMSCALIPAAGS